MKRSSSQVMADTYLSKSLGKEEHVNFFIVGFVLVICCELLGQRSKRGAVL